LQPPPDLHPSLPAVERDGIEIERREKDIGGRENAVDGR
jgi:hypothetical protein